MFVHSKNKVSRDASDYLNDNLLEEPDLPPVYESTAFRRQGVPPRQEVPPSRQENVTLPPPPSQRSIPLRQPTATRQSSGNARLVIAVDYGTTFTGFASVTAHSGQADLQNIDVLQDWTPKMSNQQKVRSTISYARSLHGEAQWGSDIRDDVITMVNTKLELELQETRLDELELTLHVLRGTGNLAFEAVRRAGSDPEYTSKSPTQIVTDYLTKICECALKVVDVDQLCRTNTAVDIVVTVPVNWSYEATNSTFKAMREAGFNKTKFATLKDTILISEPEAASYFTARDLQDGGTDFLELDDCFILCDAGGGTVDVVSFQVKRIQPYLELEKATAPTSGKYGSALIDTAFKGWLRDLIGREAYAKIDPANVRQQRISPHTAETGPMRELIKRFEAKKKTFSNSNQDKIRIDLPEPLNDLTIEGRVREGEVTIYSDEMKQLINPCVNGVIELIEKQISKVVDGKGRRVKNLFLVGGFGASPYLQEMLRESLDYRKIKMRRPDLDKSWTAVVQGAVIYGVEKHRHKDATYISAITKSYGVLISGRFEWLIRKGDVIRSNLKNTLRSAEFWVQVEGHSNEKIDFAVYSYAHKDDDDVPQLWQHGQYEVGQAGVVRCDFSNSTASHMLENSSIGPLRWHLRLSGRSMEAQVLLDKDVPGRNEKLVVGYSKFKVDVEQPSKDSADSQQEGDD